MPPHVLTVRYVSVFLPFPLSCTPLLANEKISRNTNVIRRTTVDSGLLLFQKRFSWLAESEESDIRRFGHASLQLQFLGVLEVKVKERGKLDRFTGVSWGGRVTC